MNDTQSKGIDRTDSEEDYSTKKLKRTVASVASRIQRKQRNELSPYFTILIRFILRKSFYEYSKQVAI